MAAPEELPFHAGKRESPMNLTRIRLGRAFEGFSFLRRDAAAAAITLGEA